MKVLRPFALVSILLAAASLVASAAAPQKPFLFHPPSLSQRFPEKLLDEWMAAVDAHVPGNLDSALRTIAQWDEDRIGGAYAAFVAFFQAFAEHSSKKGIRIGNWECTYQQAQQLLRLTDQELRDFDARRVLKRTALLHTDIAVAANRRAGRADAITEQAAAALHFGVALDLVDLLAEVASSDDKFPHQWYTAVGEFLADRYELVATPVFLDRILSRFGRDARVLLLAGVVQERLASPQVQNTNEARVVPIAGVEGADHHLKKAESYYRDALERLSTGARDPMVLETRLRLGRVLGLRGGHREATATLETIGAEALPPGLRYCLFLFLGEEREAIGDRRAALAAYERAILLFPLAPSGHLAVSRVERMARENSRALAEVQKVLTLRTNAESEPLVRYYAGQGAERVVALFAALEGPFRRPQ